MVCTPRHIDRLIVALIACAGLHSFRASAADPRPSRSASIVAKSTRSTAGTGRRPIHERIVASSLPQRSCATPDCTVAEQLHGGANESPVAEATESAPSAPEPPLPDSADQADFIEADFTEAAETPPEVAESEPAAAAPPEPGPDSLTEKREPVVTDAELDEVGAEADPVVVEAAVVTLPLAEPPPAPVATAPAPAPPQSRPLDAVRDTLLGRLKGAFAARPRPRVSGIPVQAPSALTQAPSAQAQPPATGSPATEASTAFQPDAAEATAVALAPQSLAAPARLEFDVRESRSLVGEGEQIVVRLAVRNVGGATAEQVTMSLFFADGIEPVQAIGHAAEVYPGEVRFASVPELSPGSSVDLLVTAVGTRPGSVAYRGELACGQLAGPIAREGAVTVQPRRAPAP